jgi:hypothetical protein
MTTVDTFNATDPEQELEATRAQLRQILKLDADITHDLFPRSRTMRAKINGKIR